MSVALLAFVSIAVVSIALSMASSTSHYSESVSLFRVLMLLPDGGFNPAHALGVDWLSLRLLEIALVACPPRVRHIRRQQSALSRRGSLRVPQGCPAIWQNNTHPRMSGIAVTPIDLKKWRPASHRQWTMATPPLPPVRAARRCCTIERHRRYQCVAMADATREGLPVHAAFVQQLSP